RVRSLPTGQGKILPYDMLQIAEGKASSAAFAFTRLGGHASLWGAVGNDDTGERIIVDQHRIESRNILLRDRLDRFVKAR
ncbi:hypothetical protein ACC730_38200, partial [Rhizobium ruizarguesonis]